MTDDQITALSDWMAQVRWTIASCLPHVDRDELVLLRNREYSFLAEAHEHDEATGATDD